MAHAESLDDAAQGEQRVTASTREQLLRLRAPAEQLVELPGEDVLPAPFDGGDTRPLLLRLS